MAYELEETGDMTRTAHVSVPFEEYNKEMNRALNELAENADMDGFRKGNVPMSVIKRKYGQRVQGDVIENLVRDQIDQFIEDLDQDILQRREGGVGLGLGEIGALGDRAGDVGPRRLGDGDGDERDRDRELDGLRRRRTSPVQRERGGDRTCAPGGPPAMTYPVVLFLLPGAGVA